jgi:proteasome lid subunit RPN8/RPN11
MDVDLELYRGEDRQFFGEYEFAPVLRKAAVLRFGDLAKRGKIELLLEEGLDSEPYPGPPEVRNLAITYGRCSLRVIRNGETVGEDSLRIVDLIGPVLARELLALRPEEAYWGFRLRKRGLALVVLGGQLARQLVGEERPTPNVKGSIEVDPDAARHRPFTLTPIAAADAETVEPSELGLDPERLGRLNILMSAEIHDQLVRTMPLANRMEEGGFLLGRVNRAGEAYLVEVTHVTPAHRSGAGAVHLTFTGDSFLAAAQLIEERGREEDLVGWYHTHLLGVGTRMGLSSIDVRLHLATFHRPWQVAALINLRTEGRLLRFFGRDGEGLREYDQWISDDSGKYRPAAPPVGGG